MPFTVQRSAHELAVRHSLPGASYLFGACVFAGAFWFLRDSAGAQTAAQLGDDVNLLMGLSLLCGAAMLLVAGVQTLRYPVQIVLDRARNRISVRDQFANPAMDFEGALSDVSTFDLVDVGTAFYSSLVRADIVAQEHGLGAPWWNRFPALKQWTFRTVSESEQFDAEHEMLPRISRLFQGGDGPHRPVRLRLTMRNGEEIMMARLKGSPARMRAIARMLTDFAREQ